MTNRIATLGGFIFYLGVIVQLKNPDLDRDNGNKNDNKSM